MLMQTTNYKLWFGCLKGMCKEKLSQVDIIHNMDLFYKEFVLLSTYILQETVC